MKVTIRKAFNMRKAMKTWLAENMIRPTTGLHTNTYQEDDLALPNGELASEFSEKACEEATANYYDNLKLRGNGNLTYLQLIEKFTSTLSDISIISNLIDKANAEQRELLIQENEIKALISLNTNLLSARTADRIPVKKGFHTERRYVNGDYVDVKVPEIEVNYDAYGQIDFNAEIATLKKHLSSIRDQISYNDNVKEIEVPDSFSEWC